MSIESDGRSADDALTVLDEPAYDPETTSDQPKQLSQVWSSADRLRRFLEAQGEPGAAGRTALKGALVYQLNTIVLYWQMGLLLEANRAREATAKTASLYILLFPGEAKDNTGIKDLNDKVIGQWWNAEFIRRRFKAIGDIFDRPGDGFMVAAQTYKTAYILTDDRDRKDFVPKLAELDEMLRIILLQILDAAEVDADSNQKKEIKALRKKLKKKGYRFDIFFGLKTIKPSAGNSKLESVYLLLTEALKGAALARYVAKVQNLGTRPARKFAKGIDPDSKKLDARGKEYAWAVYMKASDMAGKIKKLITDGYTNDSPWVLNEIYIDTVWTWTFIKPDKLYWGNPDVIRDVRKKKLEQPRMRDGNLVYSLPLQKDYLELWLVVLNLLDLVKRFKSEEFRKQVQRYHDDALEVFLQLGNAGATIDWTKLERVLTSDVRQSGRIAVFESASEFLFYSFAADHVQRLFFSMDIRDMGVELMLHYERSNREITHNRYDDSKLMEETFRASDAIDHRRRFTYDRVVDVFKRYHDRLSKDPAAKKAAQEAFGVGPVEPLGKFTDDVQLMLGGDEIYAAAHPQFAKFVPNIVADLDKTALDPQRNLELRASVSFSSAENQPRKEVQLSHQEAMRLAEEAPGTLKRLERTRRRIERLIDMLEENKAKKGKAPAYRKDLESLPLTQLFARTKHKQPMRLPSRAYKILMDALREGDIAAAQKTGRFELVDFSGNVVDGEKLEKAAETLEQKVRRDVGRDNMRAHPPPVTKMPKWIDKLLDCWEHPPC